MSCLPCIRCYTTVYCPSPKQFTKSFSVDEFSTSSAVTELYMPFNRNIFRGCRTPYFFSQKQ